MKRFLYSFLFLFAVSLSIPSYAQETQKSSQTSVSVDDVRQLGEQIKALKSIVSDEPKPEHKPETAKPVETPKTMADVSDKALNMLGSAVGTVSETLKKLGPEVWRIMIMQQYAEAAKMLFGPLFALLASLIVFFAARKSLVITEEEKDHYSDDWRIFKRVLKGATWAAPCICALIVAANLADSAAMIINPEYYALKNLLGLMTGK